MTTVYITFRGVEMEVVGNYHPATRDGFFEQGDPAVFYVEDVYIGEQCVTPLVREATNNLGISWLAGIEEAALDAAENNKSSIARQEVENFEPEEA